MPLFINGKYFLAPPKDGSDFKELFRRASAAGVGRSVDEDGFPEGPWTPELLTEAISQIDANHIGVDLRTVQLWFQNNENGVSAANIRWIARVFGCDDPAATSEWQMELREAQARLTAKRKARKKPQNALPKLSHEQVVNGYNQSDGTINIPSGSSISTKRTWKLILSDKIEMLFGGDDPMNILVFMWAIYLFNGLVNYIFGVGSVSYSPIDGVTKQVGFLWAPTWNILPLIILPLYIIFMHRFLTYWIREGRIIIYNETGSVVCNSMWKQRVDSFSTSFTVIVLICLFLVFGAQWFGVYIRLYLIGTPEDFQIDRNLLSIVRPDVITILESAIISGLGYIYTAIYIGIFLLGLLFTHIVLVDLKEIVRSGVESPKKINGYQTQSITSSLRIKAFRLSIFGLWIAMCIKLQVVYLSSDSSNIIDLLATDFKNFFAISNIKIGWLKQVSLTHFTTLLMVVLTCLVSLMGLIDLYLIDKHVYNNIINKNTSSSAVKCLNNPPEPSVREYIKVCASIIVFSVSVLLVGVFTGFSLLLVVCFIISLYCCYSPNSVRLT